MKNVVYGALLALALNCIVLVSASFALDVAMTASTVDVTMPDGVVVTMWGYSVPSDPAYATPFGPNGPPVLRTTAGDALNITLTNNLGITNPALRPETSVVIRGQNNTTMTPQTFTDANGRTRAYSFTDVTLPGGSNTYTWTNLAPGTYLIESGTHPGIQVPMGLYAVLIVDQAAGVPATAYTTGAGDITYTTDIPLLFSEVDVHQHQAVADGTYGTDAYPTTMVAGYDPEYFLINGRSYTPGQSPIPAGVEGETVLFRFLNAGLRIRMPALQGGKYMVVAEDGNPYTSITPAVITDPLLPQQYEQHVIELPAGKTIDAIATPAAGYYSIYDRRLGLVTGMESGGGMMTNFAVQSLTPTPQTLTVSMTGTGTGMVQTASLPGGIDSTATPAADLTEDYENGTAVTLKATGDPGSVLTGWTVTSGGVATGECQAPLADPYGDCVVTMDANKNVVATFDSFSAVTVVSPNGGESVLGGTGYTLHWAGPANAATYGLAYSFGSSSPWKVIAKGVTGNQYVFTVPETVPNYGDLYIAVVAYDDTGAVVGMDVSDQPAQRNSVALVTPSAADLVLTAGATYDITWESFRVPGNIATIGLWYQTGPGQPWMMITSLDSDTGSYTWTVPSVVTTQALVGVIFYDSAGEPLAIDASDNVFEIQAAAP